MRGVTAAAPACHVQTNAVEMSVANKSDLQVCCVTSVL